MTKEFTRLGESVALAIAGLRGLAESDPEGLGYLVEHADRIERDFPILVKIAGIERAFMDELKAVLKDAR